MIARCMFCNKGFYFSIPIGVPECDECRSVRMFVIDFPEIIQSIMGWEGFYCEKLDNLGENTLNGILIDEGKNPKEVVAKMKQIAENAIKNAKGNKYDC